MISKKKNGVQFWKLCLIARNLGVMPLFKQASENRFKSAVKTIYPISLVVSYVLLTLILTYYYYHTIFKPNNSTRIDIIATYLFLLSDMLFFATFVLQSVHSEGIWQAFLKNLQHLIAVSKIIRRKTFSIYAVCMNGLVLVYSAQFIYLLYHEFSRQISIRILGRCLMTFVVYYKFFFTRFVYHFTEIIISIYEEVNKNLNNALLGGNFYAHNIINIKTEINRLQKLYGDTEKLVKTFNIFIYWPLYFIVVSSAIGVVNLISLATRKIFDLYSIIDFSFVTSILSVSDALIFLYI